MGSSHGPWPCTALWLFVGCGTDVVGNELQTFADTGVAQDGNFPEPALSRCGGLPADVAPILELTSAWGVLALPGARDATGGNVEAGSIRLRFADHPLARCSESFAPGWGVSLTLSPDELGPGTYDLGAMVLPQYSVTLGGSHDGAGARQGTLVLYSVTADCVVGELREIQVRPGEPSQAGGFAAEICQRQCIPSEDEGC